MRKQYPRSAYINGEGISYKTKWFRSLILKVMAYLTKKRSCLCFVNPPLRICFRSLSRLQRRIWTFDKSLKRNEEPPFKHSLWNKPFKSSTLIFTFDIYFNLHNLGTIRLIFGLLQLIILRRTKKCPFLTPDWSDFSSVGIGKVRWRRRRRSP